MQNAVCFSLFIAQRSHSVDVAIGFFTQWRYAVLYVACSSLHDSVLSDGYKSCRGLSSVAHSGGHFRSHCTAMSRFAFLGWALLPFLAAATLGRSNIALEDTTASCPQKVLADDYGVTCENIAKSVSPASQVFYPGMLLYLLYSSCPVGGGIS
jgi:hypothetical protein